MPIYVTGDMWAVFDEADLFCIATNSTLDRYNNLIMGKGIAWDAKARFPSLPALWGLEIQPGSKYGLQISPLWNKRHLSVDPLSPYLKLAAFQTKYDWRNPSPIDLVAYSISKLRSVADENPNKSIHLPFPGIGNGGLNPFDVKPLLDVLPENVTIWRNK